MANPFHAHVNISLSQARRALDDGEDAVVLFWLYRAYLCFLREWAVNLELPDACYETVASLRVTARDQGMTVGELDELGELAEHGWLAELLAAWSALLWPSVGDAGAAPADRLAMAPAFDRQQVIEAFTELVTRHRDVSREY